MGETECSSMGERFAAARGGVASKAKARESIPSLSETEVASVGERFTAAGGGVGGKEKAKASISAPDMMCGFVAAVRDGLSVASQSRSRLFVQYDALNCRNTKA